MIKKIVVISLILILSGCSISTNDSLSNYKTTSDVNVYKQSMIESKEINRKTEKPDVNYETIMFGSTIDGIVKSITIINDEHQLVSDTLNNEYIETDAILKRYDNPDIFSNEFNIFMDYVKENVVVSALKPLKEFDGSLSFSTDYNKRLNDFERIIGPKVMFYGDDHFNHSIFVFSITPDESILTETLIQSINDDPNVIEYVFVHKDKVVMTTKDFFENYNTFESLLSEKLLEVNN